MKKIIKNLFMPFAVLAMLTVGAFTINASQKTDNTVNVETLMQNQAQEPYIGEEYYLDEENEKWVIYSSSSDGHCSLSGEGIVCTKEIPGFLEKKQMYGVDPLTGDKVLLRRITN